MNNPVTRLLAGTLTLLLTTPAAFADFVLSFDDSGFGITSSYNDVSEFSFDITVAGELVAGGVYDDPALVSVSYVIRGVLTSPTPSGFTGFLLIRNIDGAEFYELSPDASLSFAVAASADLSDGLQLGELTGTAPVFRLNAREFDQQPGRYHPPILTLNADGSGRLANADNASSFPNPPPPAGSGLIVDVAVGEEYDVALSFDPALTIVAPVPVPPLLVPFAAALAAVARCRVRRGRATPAPAR